MFRLITFTIMCLPFFDNIDLKDLHLNFSQLLLYIAKNKNNYNLYFFFYINSKQKN